MPAPSTSVKLLEFVPITELESIDNFKNTIEKDEIYDKMFNLSNLAKLSVNNKLNINNKYIVNNNLVDTNNYFQVKIVDINKTDVINNDDNEYIEIYSNQFQ